MPKIVDKEEVQGRIMDAAMSLYARVGYHTATISGIAREAGMGKGTIYLYFESKEHLTASLADRIFLGMEESFTGYPTPRSLDELAGQLKKTMQIDAERARFVRVFFEVFGPSFATPEFVKQVAAFFDRLGAYYASHIEGLQKTGEVAEGLDAQIAGRALAAMVDGIILHRGLFAIPAKRHKAMIEEAVSMAMSGLGKRRNDTKAGGNLA